MSSGFETALTASVRLLIPFAPTALMTINKGSGFLRGGCTVTRSAECVLERSAGRPLALQLQLNLRRDWRGSKTEGLEMCSK
jgi:hypothetical protein